MSTEPAPMSVSDEAIRWLVRMRSGQSTPDDHAALAVWRAARPEHEQAFREAQEIWSSGSGLRQDPTTGLVYAHPNAAQVELQAVPGVRMSMTQPGRVRQWTAAASVLLAVAVAFTCVSRPTALTADYTAPTGELRTLQLADGSEVTLNAGAAIDEETDFTRRRVLLRAGKAYFRVRTDPARRPFEVVAAGSTIIVRGTEFEVDLRDDATVEVAVTEHSVSILSPRGEVTRVEEGMRARVGPSGSLGSATRVDVGRVAAWRQGRLVAEEQPLSEVVDALSDYHRGWIVIEDAQTARLSVNAALDLHDTTASLDALAAAVPIQVRTVTPWLVVLSSKKISPGG